MVDRTKYIPAIVALSVTLVASVVTIINKYESTQALIIILSVLVGSYVVGLILKWVANTFLVVEVEEEKTEETEETGDATEGEGTGEEEDATATAKVNEEE